jgi:surfeit locus 1 family protein
VIPAYRRFLVPGLSTLAMLVILIGLGIWQVYRLHWKEGIMAQIATAEAGPPVPLRPDPAPYTKIFVTGHFRFDRAVQFGAEVRNTRIGPAMGSYQIVPLERDGASTILVARGWVPQNRDMSLDDPVGEVTVTGYIRPGEVQHWFSPADDAATRQFYTLNPEAIGVAIGLPNVEPFTVIAMGPSVAGSYPVPAQNLPRPPNNHLSYIVTWYGLAVSLVVIFCVWVQKALRS